MGGAPYGYRYMINVQSRTSFEINEEEADVVRKVFCGWEEKGQKNPAYKGQAAFNKTKILEEYKRKLSEFKRSSWDKKSDLLEKQENKLQRGIARLIDSYAQEYISQEEFEPRVKAMKQSLKAIEEEKKRIFDQKKLKQELTLVVTNLEDFSSNITSNLDNADWITSYYVLSERELEISENVNVVFLRKEYQTLLDIMEKKRKICNIVGEY
ncbi:uncharacterized protein NPIL_515381 [Nephila pilipes]|uniref:Uncharacterized protein n=1 Tax=Nephila pilipes TaxID=299642 RepID=A0A8X6N874_NEPPI|nr:uncharacterized protein NPIL_515381 [Nephila pilipes]